MFTLSLIEDDHIVLASGDSGDIARVFRLVGYDLPVPNGTRITHVAITIYKDHLTEENSNAKSTYPPHELDREADLELPF